MSGHVDVDYELAPQPPQYSDLVRRDDERILVFECPRCHGPTAQLDGDAAPGKGLRLWGRAPAAAVPEPNVVECQCGMPHPGRPENAPAWGCGAFWNEQDPHG
jgi:hypothetical protein